MDQKIKALTDFLDASVSPYHAVAALSALLEDSGYRPLDQSRDWDLIPGGKYYLTRGGSALVAFRVPEIAPQGFRMSASHCDRPSFKLKENGELTGAATRLAVERYGGMLISTWLDRPLSLAGRCLVETPNGAQVQLVNLDRDLLLIPNVAIHMNRTVNDGYKWNPAVDTIPLLGGKTAQGKFQTLLEDAAGGRVLGHDLYLYVRQKATVWGIDHEFLSAAGLDDLQCVWGCTQGFLNTADDRHIPLLCVFDSEEVGSNSVQGAASTLLETTLERICQSLGLSLPQMLSQSFMVSADNAHALHPNHPELSDPANAPVLGGGVVLKFNASQRYTTDALSCALFRKICEGAGVPVQTFCNRADLLGGSTLGHISLTHVSVPTADIGLPQLAMHSCYETAAVADALALETAMTAYYSAGVTLTEEGFTLA